MTTTRRNLLGSALAGAAVTGFPAIARGQSARTLRFSLLGALGGKFSRATVHGYGPLYGAGGAVVEFHL